MASLAQPPGESGDDRLSAYMDGEMPEADLRKVEGELAGSDLQRAKLQDLKDVSTLLRTWDATLQDAHPSQQFTAFVASGGRQVSAELRQASAEDDPIPVAEVVVERAGSPLWARILFVILVVLAIGLIWHWLGG